MSATLNDLPLSDEQRAAILNPSRLIAVDAGPGTGKTHTASARMVHLADQGIDPSRIVAVSFTRFAADEMDLRLRRLLGGRFTQAVGMGTFHGLARRIIRLDPSVIGLSDTFGVLAPKDALRIVKSTLQAPECRAFAARLHREADEQVRQVNHRIGLSYHRCETDTTLAGDGELGQLAAHCRLVLEDHQQAHNVLALDRWIPAAAAVLADPLVRDVVHGAWTEILVDEFQDSNPAQMLLLSRLIGPATTLWVVGDEDQAIYGFRGSMPGAIDQVAGQPGAHRAALTINRRCRPDIITGANRLIAHNPRSSRKALRPDLTQRDAGHFGYTQFQSDYEEGHRVVEAVGALHAQGLPYHQIMVVAPSHKLLDGLHEDLIGAGIPYTPSDGVQLAGRRHVAPVVHAIRLLLGHPLTEEQLTGCLTALRHIGDTYAERLVGAIRHQHTGALDADLTQLPGVDQRARDSVTAWQQDLIRLRRQVTPSTPVGGTVDQLLDAPWGLVALQRRLAETGTDGQAAKARRALRDIESFRGATHRLAGGEVQTLGELVAHLDRQQLIGADGGEDRVTLTTIHGSKGTEADAVLALGWEEGSLPSHHNSSTPNQVAEQRRCAFVAATRARKLCRLTSVGSRAGQPRRRSRFITESGLAA